MTTKTRIQMVCVIVAALLLAMLLGVMVTRASASSAVLWKQSCPAWADLIIIPEGTNQHVVCMAGDANDDTR